MNSRGDTHFFHLNREGGWLDFKTELLQLDQEGAVSLAPLPRLERAIPVDDSHLAPPTGPAGVAVTPDGTLFWTEPQSHRLWRRDACDGVVSQVPCLGGRIPDCGAAPEPGSGPYSLRQPRGLAYYAPRNALMLADAGNHRVLFVSLQTSDVVEVWGAYGSAPGRFDTPWAVAADAVGNVYVADYGNRRVQKFDPFGNPVPGFWLGPRTGVDSWRPSDLAVAPDGRLHVLDRVRNEILVLDRAGSPIDILGLPRAGEAQGLLVESDTLLVGVNGARELWALQGDGTPLGPAHSYLGPVAALAAQAGTIWVHQGQATPPLGRPEPPLRFERSGAHVRSGSMVGGPFGPGDRVEVTKGSFILRPVLWHRLKALGTPLPPGAHLQFFVAPTPAATSLPKAPFPDPTVWHPLPEDADDALVWRESPYVWVAAILASDDGLHTPRLNQIRLHYDHEGYGRFLPAAYYEKVQDPLVKRENRERLDRFLALFESHFADTEEAIVQLERQFDAATVPEDWLGWLASWLAVELEEGWPAQRKREVIQGAFAAAAWRGTPRGLKAALRTDPGVEARVIEPIRHTSWWSLAPADFEDTPRAEMSILGITTMLPLAEAQGAVLGGTLAGADRGSCEGPTPPCEEQGKSAKATARLDASHLIHPSQFGEPLFAEVAHRFTVELYEAEVAAPGMLERVHAVIQREKPAHTDYRICVIEPRLRIGLQARLGVDTLLGGGPAVPSRLGESAETVLAGRSPGRIGEAELGRTLRLGESAGESQGKQG